MTPEQERTIRASLENTMRYERDPDWIEAHINLIDALRVMIRVDTRLGEEFLRDGSITRKQYNKGMAEVRKMREMLAGLEKFEVDPTLDGWIKK